MPSLSQASESETSSLKADFRSDTVTRPSRKMRQAMAAAVVGDDVFGDDPTVLELERAVAKLLGKEAGLFLPSGTMANQVGLRCHAYPGDEILMHEDSHTFLYEQGGLAGLSGLQSRTRPGKDGRVPVQDFEQHVRGDDPHLPRTKVVVIENTHNMAGGKALPTSYLNEVGVFAVKHDLAFHIDGARILNAAVALDEAPDTLVAAADSLTLCLSKGVGAPVGTVLAGAEAFIRRAHRARKLMGGGMRQVGVLAAPALVALEDWKERLHADHERAKHLAEELTSVAALDVVMPETNIVVMNLIDHDVHELLKQLEADDVLAVPFGAGRIRFCTHRDVGDEDIQRAVSALRRALT